MARQLKKRLDTQCQDESELFVDVGGGMGVTAQRLAVYFEDAVKQSKIAFAVTNLRSPHYVDAGGKTAPNERLQKASQGSVHFIGTPFSQLFRQSVLLPNDRTLPLKGNVSLIHEKLALTAWSQVPELHIRQIGHLLVARAGLYMVPRIDILNPRRIAKHAYCDDQVRGIGLTHVALERDFGIILSEGYADQVPGVTDYAVFRSRPA